MCVCVYVCVYIYICMYIYVYIYELCPTQIIQNGVVLRSLTQLHLQSPVFQTSFTFTVSGVRMWIYLLRSNHSTYFK